MADAAGGDDGADEVRECLIPIARPRLDRLRRMHRPAMKPRVAAIGVALLLACGAGLAACPVDPSAPADTLLSLRLSTSQAAPIRLDRRALAALGEQQLTQRRSVAATMGASAPALEQTIVYAGVPLGRVVAAAASDDRQGRDQRGWVYEAVATDGYRAIFSWGELFNTDAAEQVLVITAQDGQPLTAAEGPLALRALGDRRPGPRHVRNLCAIVARALPPTDR